MKNKYLFILTSLIIIAGIICSVKIDYQHLEPRNDLFNIIANGFLAIVGVSLLIAIIIVDLYKKKRYLQAVIFVPFFLLAMFFAYLSTQFYPNYIDVAIYHNVQKVNNKLVFQYFETGITGNPNSRFLITENVDAAIRSIQIINEKLLPDSLQELESKTIQSMFPQSLVVGNTIYKFEKFIDYRKRD